MEAKMETSKQQIETLKANSFSGRYGGVGSDFKLYFDTIEDLKRGIDAVIEAKAYLADKLAEPDKIKELAAKLPDDPEKWGVD
jgi:hypothetical protein